MTGEKQSVNEILQERKVPEYAKIEGSLKGRIDRLQSDIKGNTLLVKPTDVTGKVEEFLEEMLPTDKISWADFKGLRGAFTAVLLEHGADRKGRR